MAAGPANNCICLVDAHSLIFQVFHAIRQPMTSPAGLPTNALFGFCRDLLQLRQQQPRYLICAFDRSEPTFRSDIYPDYKAHRPPMPSDLHLQIPLIQQALDAMAVPIVSHPRFEADDIIATLARAGAERGQDVLIYTSDKDCRQLLGDRVRMFNLRKGTPFGPEELRADWGIKPDQVIDLQTLVGDSVDNVPGVAGIGVKTAAKLLQEFGTLDAILQNIDKVPGASKQENLRAAIPLLPISRQLVALATDVPIAIDWDAWQLKPMDVPRLLALFQEWGFHSFARQVRDMAGAENGARKGRLAAVGAKQGSLFPDIEDRRSRIEDRGSKIEDRNNKGPLDPRSSILDPRSSILDPRSSKPEPVLSKVGDPEWQADYRLVDTPELFEVFVAELGKQPRFAMDLETTSLSPLSAEIVGLAFAWEEGHAWYVPLRGEGRRVEAGGSPGSAVLDAAVTLARLRAILENPAVAKVNQNIKYDLLVLRGKGIHVQGVAGDCMVADYLLHAGERTHNLEELARRYLNHQVIPIEDLIGKKSRKQPQLCMDQVPTERVAVYAGEDADVAWRLCRLLEAQLGQGPGQPAAEPLHREAPLRKLYDDLEIPLIEVLVELEANGIRIDIPKLRELSAAMGRQLQEIEEEIYRLAGHPFAINSLVQLRTVLFDELRLPRQRKTGITGAASTNQETLEKLAALDHPAAALPRKILEQRQIAKLKGTYVDALPGLVNPLTGRVHASFNQTVASTGRLSASDPNLQNIPVRREQGQQIRSAFLPAEGWVLVTADYSQIELRLLAHFSGDEEMRRAFAEDRDIHTIVAAQIFHVPEKDVTWSQRRAAKTVNFGVIYGMSAFGLAQQLSIPRAEAEKFIDAYFARYPRVLQYQTRLLERCRKTGAVTTILGRRRRFDPAAIRAGSRYQQRNQAEREAINMEVQGSAADLIKMAMLNVLRRMRREGLRRACSCKSTMSWSLKRRPTR